MSEPLFWRCAKDQNSLLSHRKSIIGATGGRGKLKNNNNTSASGHGEITGIRFIFLPETIRQEQEQKQANKNHQYQQSM